MTRIYIAAPMPHRERAVAMATRLREIGHVVTSTWHDQQWSGDPTDPFDAARVATGNTRDMRAAGELVVLPCPHGTHGREMWVEVGAWIASGNGAFISAVVSPGTPVALSLTAYARMFPTDDALVEAFR